MEDDGPIADAFRMPSFIISNVDEGRVKLSRNLLAESFLSDAGKVGDTNRGVIRSNSLDEGDRNSRERSGEEEERDAEGNNNNNCNGGGGGGRRARRRASAVDILRRNFGDSKSPSLRLSTKSRMPSGAEHGTDEGSGRNELQDGRGEECDECRKSYVETGGTGAKNEHTPSEFMTFADECHHVSDREGNTTTSGEPVSATEHVYCSVYCIANDAEITAAVAPSSDGTGDDSRTGQVVVGPSPDLELYSLDDVADLMGDVSQRQHREQADSDSDEAECCQVCLEERLTSRLPCCRRAVCAGCLKLYVSSQVCVCVFKVFKQQNTLKHNRSFDHVWHPSCVWLANSGNFSKSCPHML